MIVTAIDVTCPNCQTVSWFEELNRDAGAFCRKCDYPLFWVRSTRLAGPGAAGDAGLRRLPGTVGLEGIPTVDCPECSEPNPESRVICVRCGADLHPPPPTEPVYRPPPSPPPPAPVVYQPPPPPPPPKRLIWPWVLLGVLFVIGVVLLVVLLVT
jgi:hypothetical protein